MNQSDFGKKVMQWGTGDDAARARIGTPTREELADAGVTPQMAEHWRDLYRYEARVRGDRNPSAAGRADLMDHAAKLLRGE